MDRRRRLGLAHVITGGTLLVGLLPDFLAGSGSLFSLSTLSAALIAFGGMGLLVGGVLALAWPDYAGRLAIETEPSRLHCRSMYVVTACVVLGTLLTVA